MYFAKIESSRAANIAFNNSLKQAAARRLGELQRSEHGSAKRASMLWNIENKWANGAVKGTRADGTIARTINRKQAKRLEQRLAVWSAGNGKSKADHKHHRPGSYNK